MNKILTKYSEVPSSTTSLIGMSTLVGVATPIVGVATLSNPILRLQDEGIGRSISKEDAYVSQDSVESEESNKLVSEEEIIVCSSSRRTVISIRDITI